MNNSTKTKSSWLKKSIVTLLGLVLIIVVMVYWSFRGSLAQLEGTITGLGISEAVTIERDAQGLVTIRSNSRSDIAYAMGYVHAQERFFQMDLLRRRGAGELSELFGKRALEVDKSARLHRFRTRAKQHIEKFTTEQKQIFESYTLGVNAGLQQLDNKPFEYYLLQVEPQQWLVEDSLLSSYAMYFSLQSDYGRQEWQQFLVQQTLPLELTQFLLPMRSIWDAPVEVEAIAKDWQPQPLPEHSPFKQANQNSKNTTTELEVALQHEESSQFGVIGSNNWAVAGAMTKTGSAMMANDMHLGLSVPNTWFRMRLINPSTGLDASGVTLPGGPLIIAGSNTFVSWGFTNSYGDWGDLIQLTINPDNEMQYRNQQGFTDFIIHQETIKVKAQENVILKVKDSEWGPVVKGPSDDLMAYKWVAHYSQGMNAGLLEMEKMKSVEQALSIVDKIGMPAQNAMLADRFGNIAWTIFGAIPKRHYTISANEDGTNTTLENYTQPADWSKGGYAWEGWLSASEYPRIKNPQNFRLWTANSRVVSGENLAKVGDGHYALGARAQQIRDDLNALQHPIQEQQLLDIQLDDKALFLSRWHTLMLDTIEQSSNSQLQLFKQPLIDWGASASVDSIGYRLVKEFRLKLARTLFAAITAPCKEKFEKCNYYQATHLWEEPLWSLVSLKNPDWLPQPHKSWQQFLEAMVEESFQPILNGEVPISEYTWGNKNKIKIKHPLSGAVPGLSALTDMPIQSYSGDRDMPKAATSRFGASERMVISPGHEEDAILHMPTSQAGHPLSPYYGVGHNDWVEGKATPLLPGKTVWILRLEP